MAAIKTLGALGPVAKPAVPALVAEISDPRSQFAADAAYALWQIQQDPLAVQALFTLLHGDAGPNYAGAARAAEYLGQIGRPAARAAPRLLEIINDTRTVGGAMPGPVPGAGEDMTRIPRVTIALALWEIRRHPEAVEAVVQVLETAAACPRQTERADYFSLILPRAARSLAEFGHGAPSPVPHLLNIMDGHHDSLAVAAAETLWTLQEDERALATLAEAAAQGHYSAIQSLGRIGPKAKVAAPALKQCLNDRNAVIRVEAFNALRQIDLQASAEAQQEFLRQSEVAARSATPRPEGG